MARRKQSGAEDFLDLVALLPWWAGVGLALLSYLVLHQLAGQPVTAPAQPGQMGHFAAQTIGKVLAGFGQYIVPLLCLAGAGMSAYRRHERRALMTHAREAKAADMLDGMSWRRFEMLVGEAFRQRSYQVTETGANGPDGGVDLVLRKDNEKFLVQCKQWKALRVGVDVVRELYGVMAAKGATGGFVVTSGRFTDEARAFADGRNVKLIDGHVLQGWIRGSSSGTERPERAAPHNNAVASVPQREPATCPACASPMVKRTAQRGANRGNEFWGCIGYPSCRGTRSIPSRPV
jgi:restriction system protein